MHDDDDIQKHETDVDELGLSVETENVKDISYVIENESLTYIGGFVVKKFIHKYPHLGDKINSNENTGTPRWTEFVNRGGLHLPSDYFLRELNIMREVFKAVHGEGLRTGQDCIKSLVSDMEKCGVTLPNEVIKYFALLSVRFRIIHLNRVKESQRGMACRKAKNKMAKIIR